MSFVPSYIIYANDGSTPVYDIEFVQGDNSPQDPKNFITHTGLRGQGEIDADGSESAWDLILDIALCGDDYEDLIAKMDSIEATIVKNTEYFIKIGRTSSSTKDYKVKRLVPIQWAPGRRTGTQKGKLILRVNTWT